MKGWITLNITHVCSVSTRLICLVQKLTVSLSKKNLDNFNGNGNGNLNSFNGKTNSFLYLQMYIIIYYFITITKIDVSILIQGIQLVIKW